jgi:hypothetical protein
MRQPLVTAIQQSPIANRRETIATQWSYIFKAERRPEMPGMDVGPGTRRPVIDSFDPPCIGIKENYPS